MTQPTKIGPGRLVLVVGPSGVGVDSMIDAARANFLGDARFRFVRRTITRPAGAGGEIHTPVAPSAFEAAAASGAFALHWQAHGHAYGVPSDIDDDIRTGMTVVANVSRSVVETARNRYANLAVASITARREVLAERLKKRNRETVEEIERRLDRADKYHLTGPDIFVICNDKPLSVSSVEFMRILDPS